MNKTIYKQSNSIIYGVRLHRKHIYSFSILLFPKSTECWNLGERFNCHPIRLPDDAYCSLEIISKKVPQQLNLDLLIACLVEQEKIPTQT